MEHKTLNHFNGARLEGDGGRQHGEQRHTGQWPEPLRNTCCEAAPSGTEPSGEQSLQWQAERADQIVILGRLGAYMEAEPTPSAVRAFARRWALRIGQLADDIAAAKAKEANR